MERQKNCGYHENGSTKPIRIFGQNKLACNVGTCPYGNLHKIYYSGEPVAEICNTNGKLEKIMIFDPLNILTLA
jgi:hypothetical protein